MIEKVGLDEGYGFGDIGQFIKSEKLPYVFYYGTLYIIGHFKICEIKVTLIFSLFLCTFPVSNIRSISFRYNPFFHYWADVGQKCAEIEAGT